MPAALLLAAAVTAFGPPLPDAELADARAAPAFALIAPTPLQPVRWSAFATTPLLGEQLDTWWADERLAMIARAARPLATAAPAGLNLDALLTGRIDLRLNVTATIRP